MAWADLLFLHWPIDPDRVAPSLPDGFELDTFNDRAWLALVPFRMTDCAFRGFGWAPGLRHFYECNVRTYVRVGDRRGVWFFSLDAESRLAVLGGRWMWNLNYVHSRFDVRHERDRMRYDYALKRRRGPWSPGRTHVVWETGDRLPPAEPGSLEHFLTERYWLFTLRRGRVYAGRVRHDPWPLRRARVEHIDDTLLAAAGFEGVASEPPASVLATDRIEVEGESLVAA
jgi:uncharacterized protein